MFPKLFRRDQTSGPIEKEVPRTGGFAQGISVAIVGHPSSTLQLSADYLCETGAQISWYPPTGDVLDALAANVNVRVDLVVIDIDQFGDWPGLNEIVQTLSAMRPGISIRLVSRGHVLLPFRGG